MIPEDPRKILVIRLSSIGDILLTSPLLRSLRRRFPQAQIDFCLKERYADLVKGHPYLRRRMILAAPYGWSELCRMRRLIRAEKYDLIVDVHRNLRSLFLRDRRARIASYAKHYWKRWLLVHAGVNRYQEVVPVYRRYLAGLAPWGVQPDGQGLEFFLFEEDKAVARSRLAEFGLDPSVRRIGFAVGAGHATKQWPAEQFIALAGLFGESLAGRTAPRIFLYGDDRDRTVAGRIATAIGSAAIDLSGALNLRETAAMIAAMDLMVTNDSGLMHLAVALGIKTVSIFGCTTRELGFFPDAPFSRVVENTGLACRPCTAMGRRRCPKGHFRCMTEVTPEQVAAAAMPLLTG
ncbi:MAG TPA: glycosyltransferase family 9 protein [bacterium]|nr:glycosyltransferase family 9 protein [bacterium]